MATTTLSRMMKKSASSLLIRQVFRTTSIPARYRQLSALAGKKSNSDDTFLRVIESEIDSSEHGVCSLYHSKVPELPRDFPFRIEDNAEEGYLILTRDYEGEMIKVIVRTGLSDDYVDMKVSVSKESGVTLEFDITVASEDRFIHGSIKEDRIEINSLAIKNRNDPVDFWAALEAPSSWELHHSVKTALLTYLEARGIEPSYNKFLYEYYNSIVKKKDKKYTALLKNLKTFIAN